MGIEIAVFIRIREFVVSHSLGSVFLEYFSAKASVCVQKFIKAAVNVVAATLFVVLFCRFQELFELILGSFYL